MAYTDPTAAELKVRFPRFADVADETIEVHLEEARRSVDTSWTEGDYAMGQMLRAAHTMTLEGLGTGTEAELAGQGISDFESVRSGSFSFTRAKGSESAASGTIGSTSYGRRWLALAQANRGGPSVTPSGTLPEGGPWPHYPYWPR
jgi:hypothetical protein